MDFHKRPAGIRSDGVIQFAFCPGAGAADNSCSPNGDKAGKEAQKLSGKANDPRSRGDKAQQHIDAAAAHRRASEAYAKEGNSVKASAHARFAKGHEDKVIKHFNARAKANEPIKSVKLRV